MEEKAPKQPPEINPNLSIADTQELMAGKRSAVEKPVTKDGLKSELTNWHGGLNSAEKFSVGGSMLGEIDNVESPESVEPPRVTREDVVNKAKQTVGNISGADLIFDMMSPGNFEAKTNTQNTKPQKQESIDNLEVFDLVPTEKDTSWQIIKNGLEQ